MANTVNLGSVVPGLKPLNIRRKITEKDSAGRYYIDTTPLVFGHAYLEIKLLTTVQNAEILVYLTGRSTIAGKLANLYEVPESGGLLFRSVIPLPFNYSIGTENIGEIWLIEEGKNY